LARAAGDEAPEVLENILSGLIAEIGRLEQKPRTVTLRREGLDGIVSVLRQGRQEGRSDVFCAWLAPVVASLHPHVRRELQIRQLESNFGSGQLIPDDILDEVLVRAHEQFDRRPPQLPLDLWLLGLADQILDESCRQFAEQSLDEQTVQPSSEPRQSSRDSWIEWATSSETTALAQLLPATPAVETWQSLGRETQQSDSDRVLAQLPLEQRQALILHTAYGFSVAEVADFQDRSAADVRADAGQAQQAIAHHFRQEQLEDVERRLQPQSRRANRRGSI
jgi:DNA-directed RNA polymerase specialized sigma24 family protein